MPKHLLRPLLIIEFLIALESIYTAWSEVGGQYHLDLMFWPWKMGIGFGAAWLITAITGNIVRNGGAIRRRVYLYASLLCLVVATAGVVTWYYHMHEPVDQQDEDDDVDQDSVTPAVFRHIAGEKKAASSFLSTQASFRPEGEAYGAYERSDCARSRTQFAAMNSILS